MKMTLMAISMGQRTCTQETTNITQTWMPYFLLKSLPLPGGDLQANVCGDLVGETTLKNHCPVKNDVSVSERAHPKGNFEKYTNLDVHPSEEERQ